MSDLHYKIVPFDERGSIDGTVSLSKEVEQRRYEKLSSLNDSVPSTPAKDGNDDGLDAAWSGGCGSIAMESGMEWRVKAGPTGSGNNGISPMTPQRPPNGTQISVGSSNSSKGSSSSGIKWMCRARMQGDGEGRRRLCQWMHPVRAAKPLHRDFGGCC